MAETSLPLYVGVETVKQDLGVSRAKAYEIINVGVINGRKTDVLKNNS